MNANETVKAVEQLAEQVESMGASCEALKRQLDDLVEGNLALQKDMNAREARFAEHNPERDAALAELKLATDGWDAQKLASSALAVELHMTAADREMPQHRAIRVLGELRRDAADLRAQLVEAEKRAEDVDSVRRLYLEAVKRADASDDEARMAKERVERLAHANDAPSVRDKLAAEHLEILRAMMATGKDEAAAMRELADGVMALAEKARDAKPACGVWRDHYNRCHLPAGHAGEHYDGDRLRWPLDEGHWQRPENAEKPERPALVVEVSTAKVAKEWLAGRALRADNLKLQGIESRLDFDLLDALARAVLAAAGKETP